MPRTAWPANVLPPADSAQWEAGSEGSLLTAAGRGAALPLGAMRLPGARDGSADGSDNVLHATGL